MADRQQTAAGVRYTVTGTEDFSQDVTFMQDKI